MNEIIQNISDTFLAQSWLEVIAVISAVLYLVLVVRENIWCWFFAFISTAIFIYLFYHVSLLSESILNIYYLFMAVYGWWQWHKKGLSKAVKIQNWSINTHVKIMFVTVILTPIIGTLMVKLGASFAYLDAFVSILAVIATVMVAYKVFENWYYWLVVDTLSVYLFWQKQMYLTAILFVVYIALVFVGIKTWKGLMEKPK